MKKFKQHLATITAVALGAILYVGTLAGCSSAKGRQPRPLR